MQDIEGIWEIPEEIEGKVSIAEILSIIIRLIYMPLCMQIRRIIGLYCVLMKRVAMLRNF